MVHIVTRKRACLFVASVSAVAASSSFAALKTWDAGGVAGNPGTWSATPSNWDADTAPVAGDDLRFPTVATGLNRTMTNDFPAGTVFGNVDFAASAYSVGGNSFTVGGDLLMTAGAASSFATISAPLVLNHNTTIQVNGVTSGTQPRLQIDGDISGAFGIVKTGTGVLRITTGTKTYTGDTRINAGTLDVTSGSLPNGVGSGSVYLEAGAFLFSNNVAFSMNGLNDGSTGGGTVTKGGNGSRTITIGSGNANGSFSGGFSLAGTGGASTAVTKTGTGTQIFSGNLTATGQLPNLNANGGKLLINGNFALAGPTTVGTAGLLGGSGSIGNTTVNGQLAPGGNLAGDTTAVFTTGNLTISSTGSVQLDIDGTARGTAYDGVDVGATNTLAYNGTLNLDLGAAPAAGTYDLFKFTLAPTGSFSAINVTGALSGTLTNTAGVWSGTFGSTSLEFTQSTGDLVVVVPEPASLAAMVVLGNFVLRRRRSDA